jgi:DNA-binding NarL/FixJ family response regulator
VIILTTFDRDDYVFQGVRAGALGYLLKDMPAGDVIQIIRRVYSGEVFIQPEIASRATCNCSPGNATARSTFRT